MLAVLNICVLIYNIRFNNSVNVALWKVKIQNSLCPPGVIIGLNLNADYSRVALTFLHLASAQPRS